MSPEMFSLQVHELIRRINEGMERFYALPSSDPSTWANKEHMGEVGWYSHHVDIVRQYGSAVREAVEKHFRSLGYEVKREMRLSDGQRLRALWLRKTGAQ
jgi:hypothetical protein